MSHFGPGVCGWFPSDTSVGLWRKGGRREGGRERREKKEMCRIYRQTDLNPFRSGSVPHVLLHWALCFFFPSSSYNRYQTHTHTHTWMAAPPAVVRRDGSAERTISGCWTNPQSNRRFLFFLSFFYSFFFLCLFWQQQKKVWFHQRHKHGWPNTLWSPVDVINEQFTDDLTLHVC